MMWRFLACGLPSGAFAALSIDSPYEEIIFNLRDRICVFEGDLEKVPKKICNSFKDGPYCSPLHHGEHVPHVVDGITSRVLNDWHLNSKNRVLETLSEFILQTLPANPADAKIDASPTFDGALDLGPTIAYRDFPSSYNHGLPEDMVTDWKGSWTPVYSASSENTKTALRLDTAISKINFSSPVVVQRMLVRAPANATRPMLRAWGRTSEGVETWRAETTDAPRQHCKIGDVVNAKWRGNENWFRCLIAGDHGTSFTCHWLDGDVTYRQIIKQHAQKNDQWCDAGMVNSTGQRLWIDIANPSQAFSVLTIMTSEPGWELSELHVSSSSQPGSRMVIRVTPNSMTLEDVSTNTVTWSLNEMTRLGYKLKDGSIPSNSASDVVNQKGEDFPDPRYSRLWHFVSSTSFLEFMRNLRYIPLPPGLRLSDILSDIHELLAAITLSNTPKKRKGKMDASAGTVVPSAEVTKHVHIEEHFLLQWDLRKIDHLEAAFESARRQMAFKRIEAPVPEQNFFKKGQIWEGSYFCSQGMTGLWLKILQVQQWTVEAQFDFAMPKQDIEGSYKVRGTLDPFGYGMAFEPIPDTWLKRPQSFAAIGLHGVVSLSGLRYTGSIPVFGCDSFVLVYNETKTNAKATMPQGDPPAAAPGDKIQTKEAGGAKDKSAKTPPPTPEVESLDPSDTVKAAPEPDSPDGWTRLPSINAEKELALKSAEKKLLEMRDLWRSELKAHMAGNKNAREAEPDTGGLGGSLNSLFGAEGGGKGGESMSVDGVAQLLKLLMNQEL